MQRNIGGMFVDLVMHGWMTPLDEFSGSDLEHNENQNQTTTKYFPLMSSSAKVHSFLKNKLSKSHSHFSFCFQDKTKKKRNLESLNSFYLSYVLCICLLFGLVKPWEKVSAISRAIFRDHERWWNCVVLASFEAVEGEIGKRIFWVSEQSLYLLLVGKKVSILCWVILDRYSELVLWLLVSRI